MLQILALDEQLRASQCIKSGRLQNGWAVNVRRKTPIGGQNIVECGQGWLCGSAWQQADPASPSNSSMPRGFPVKHRLAAQLRMEPRVVWPAVESDEHGDGI